MPISDYDMQLARLRAIGAAPAPGLLDARRRLANLGPTDQPDSRISDADYAAQLAQLQAIGAYPQQGGVTDADYAAQLAHLADLGLQPQPMSFEQQVSGALMQSAADNAARGDAALLERQVQKFNRMKARQKALSPEVEAVQRAQLQGLQDIARYKSADGVVGESAAAPSQGGFRGGPATGDRGGRVGYPVNEPGLGQLRGQAEGGDYVVRGPLTGVSTDVDRMPRQGPLGFGDLSQLMYEGKVTPEDLRGVPPEVFNSAMGDAIQRNQQDTQDQANRDRMQGALAQTGLFYPEPQDIVTEGAGTQGPQYPYGGDWSAPVQGSHPVYRGPTNEMPDIFGPVLGEQLRQLRTSGGDQNEGAQALIRALAQRNQPTWY